MEGLTENECHHLSYFLRIFNHHFITCFIEFIILFKDLDSCFIVRVIVRVGIGFIGGVRIGVRIWVGVGVEIEVVIGLELWTSGYNLHPGSKGTTKGNGHFLFLPRDFTKGTKGTKGNK